MTTKETVKVAHGTRLGGWKSEECNTVLVQQACNALWLKNSDASERQKQITATRDALIGIDPKDEIDGQIAAKMLAAHGRPTRRPAWKATRDATRCTRR